MIKFQRYVLCVLYVFLANIHINIQYKICKYTRRVVCVRWAWINFLWILIFPVVINKNSVLLIIGLCSIYTLYQYAVYMITLHFITVWSIVTTVKCSFRFTLEKFITGFAFYEINVIFWCYPFSFQCLYSNIFG